MLKGKILFFIALLVCLILTAGAAAGGYFAGTALEEQLGATLIAYNWDMITAIFAAVLGGLMLLITLPPVITARQVSRMYNVSYKYGKWSVSSAIIGVLMLLVAGAGIAYVVLALGNLPPLVTMMLAQYGVTLNVQTMQVGAGIGVGVLCLLLFLPLIVAVRSRDGVGAMLRKKRAYASDDEDEE